jgi:hypothetical protein
LWVVRWGVFVSAGRAEGRCVVSSSCSFLPFFLFGLYFYRSISLSSIYYLSPPSLPPLEKAAIEQHAFLSLFSCSRPSFSPASMRGRTATDEAAKVGGGTLRRRARLSSVAGRTERCKRWKTGKGEKRRGKDGQVEAQEQREEGGKGRGGSLRTLHTLVTCTKAQ